MFCVDLRFIINYYSNLFSLLFFSSNTKNQSNNQNKSQKVMNQQQPCTSKLSIAKTQPLMNNKQTNSSNISQTIKQNDLKYNVSSVQHPMATVTQIQLGNKQTTGNQQPTTSKNTLVSLHSASNKVISLSVCQLNYFISFY